MIRIEVVDDHVVVRSGLKLLVESHPGLAVVAEAGTIRDAVAAAERERPDLVLLDLSLGRESGIDAVSQLKIAAPGVRVLVLTGITDEDAHEEAIRRGASGVVLKESAGDTLLKAIETVHAGEVWLKRTVTARLLRELGGPTAATVPDPQQARIATLTPREREVVVLLARGLRNREIAAQLHLSEATVRHHLTSIFGKLDTPDRLTLVIYAFEHGLASPPH